MDSNPKVINGIKSYIDSTDIDGQNKKYQKMYDRIAPFYNFANKIYFLLKFKGEANYRKQFLNELEIINRHKVLEVSCGTGDNFPYLPQNIDLHGLDISLGMLKKCKKHLKKWKLQANLYHASAEKLPFQNETFDVVFHVGGINFFNDKKKAIDEMIRVAKKGTKIVVVDETEKLVKGTYKNIPIVGKHYKNQDKVKIPLDIIPEHIEDVNVKEICNGLMYCLTFRVPT